LPRIRLDELAATHRFDEVVRGSRRVLQIGGFSKTDMAIVAAVTALEGETVDLNKFMPLRGTDGSIRFVPPQWETMHFASGETFLELARSDPENWAEAPITRPIGYIERLIKHFRPEFDDLPLDKRVAFIEETSRRIGKFLESLDELMRHLEYGEPGRNLRPPAERPDRDVRAAILKDVHGKTYPEVGGLLDIASPPNFELTRAHRNAENAVKRGRAILGAHYRGGGGWPQRAEVMKGMIDRLSARDNLKDQFIELLAQESGVSFQEAYRAAVEDGFNEKIDAWVGAWERDDHRLAVELQLSDQRFNVLDKVLG
jgi:hypothetical protein